MRSTHEPSADAGGSSLSREPCVIGLAHGSRHPQVRATIESLMSAVGAELGVPARAAFLDLTDPDLDAVATELAQDGHDHAVVVPLLFTQAFHATVDVPEALAAASAASGVRLELAAILGTGDDVLAVLDDSAATAGIAPGASVLLFAVGSSRPEANAAVADLAARLAARRGSSAAAGFGTTEPRAEAVLATLSEPIAVLPLFLAPGLLLDPIMAAAGKRGWTVAEPLGDLAVPLVVQRYLAATADRAPVN